MFASLGLVVVLHSQRVKLESAFCKALTKATPAQSDSQHERYNVKPTCLSNSVIASALPLDFTTHFSYSGQDAACRSNKHVPEFMCSTICIGEDKPPLS
jgi:hypothetical protein